MADDVELDYAYLTQDALRGVVRQVLSTTVALGHPPGEHHFYIEFVTVAPGVFLSDRLRAQYPERMTIVLQHQFEALEVDEEGFAVTLHFKGTPDRLIVPFSAITQFADPSANFALQFQPPEAAGSGAKPGGRSGGKADVAPLAPPGGADSLKKEDEGGDDGDGDGSGDGGKKKGADVVSLDHFRKK